MVPYDACLSKAGAILPKRKKEKKFSLSYTCRLYISRLPIHFHHPPRFKKTAKYALFSSIHGTCTKRAYLGHKTNLKKFKIIDIT